MKKSVGVEAGVEADMEGVGVEVIFKNTHAAFSFLPFGRGVAISHRKVKSSFLLSLLDEETASSLSPSNSYREAVEQLRSLLPAGSTFQNIVDPEDVFVKVYYNDLDEDGKEVFNALKTSKPFLIQKDEKGEYIYTQDASIQCVVGLNNINDFALPTQMKGEVKKYLDFFSFLESRYPENVWDILWFEEKDDCLVLDVEYALHRLNETKEKYHEALEYYKNRIQALKNDLLLLEQKKQEGYTHILRCEYDFGVWGTFDLFSKLKGSTLEVYIEDNYVGLLIGKGGERIKKILSSMKEKGFSITRILAKGNGKEIRNSFLTRALKFSEFEALESIENRMHSIKESIEENKKMIERKEKEIEKLDFLIKYFGGE